MDRRTLVEYPDPRLRAEARPVDAFDADLAALAGDLAEMATARGALGLSAPQVGDDRRVLVVNAGEGDEGPEVYVNPEILHRAAFGVVQESCVSIPGVEGMVLRATEVRVRARDVAGAAFERALTGMEAVSLQHELDHLDGVLFIDRLFFLRRWLVRAAARRRAGRGAEGF